MNILFVNSGLRFGGAETQLIAILAELKQRGHLPSLYLLTQDAPRINQAHALGIPVKVDNKQGKLDWGVLRRLRAHICQLRPDLVHGFLFDANVYARVAAAGMGVPVLCSERSDNYRLRRSQAIAHYPTRALAHGVVANTHAGRKHAQGMYGLTEKHTHVVWNGVGLPEMDLRLSHPLADYRSHFFGDASVKLATLVGVISPAKDYELAITVVEHLVATHPDWRALFVGASFGDKLSYANATAQDSNAYAERIKQRLEQSPAKGKMHFAGQRSDALEIIKSSDVLFSTSRHEGFPNVVLEAMVAGTPVVSTEYSDIRRILPEAWQVVPGRNPLLMAQAIVRAQQNHQALGKCQRDWVQANATIERSVDKLLDVYAQYGRSDSRGG